MNHRRRILVTGARGFIGRHLVRRLIADGDEVYATIRTGAPLDQLGAEWVKLDLAEPSAVAAMVGHVRPDAILHLASFVRGDRRWTLSRRMLDDNVRTTVNLMESALALPDCRVVLAGSIEEPRALDSTAGAHSPYAASKLAATAFATFYRDVHRLPVTVLRICMVYGPDQPDESKLIPYVTTSLLAGRSPKLGSGTRLVDWIYVEDVVDAFLAALTARPGAVVDVGSGTAVSIREVIEMLAAQIGAEVAVGFGELSVRVGDRAHIADPRPAAEELGWWPRTSLAEGLQATIDWYRRHRNDVSQQ